MRNESQIVSQLIKKLLEITDAGILQEIQQDITKYLINNICYKWDLLVAEKRLTNSLQKLAKIEMSNNKELSDLKNSTIKKETISRLSQVNEICPEFVKTIIKYYR